MRRIVIFLAAVFTAVSASAQYVDTEKMIDIKGSRLFIDGEKLSKEEAYAFFQDMNGMDRSQDYIRYRKGYKAGLGMIIGGGSLTLAGGLTLLGGAVSAMVIGVPFAISGKDMPKGVDIAITAGGVSVLAGTAVMLAGVPTICVYKKRLKGLEEEYNSGLQSQDVELTFGSQPYGVGFALRF